MIVNLAQMILMMSQTSTRTKNLIIQMCFLLPIILMLKKCSKSYRNHLTSTVSTRKPQPLVISCLKEDLNLIFGEPPTLCTQYPPMTRNSSILATPKGNSENESRNMRLHAKGTSPISNQMKYKTVGSLFIKLQWGRVSNLKKQRFLREKRTA